MSECGSCDDLEVCASGHVLTASPAPLMCVVCAVCLCVRLSQPAKVIYVSGSGGLRDGNDRVIEQINMREDFNRLVKEPWMKHGTLLKLKEIKSLLDGLPRRSRCVCVVVIFYT